MNIKSWLIRLTLALSFGLVGWLVYEIGRSGISWASGGLLAYAILVVVTCWASLRRGIGREEEKGEVASGNDNQRRPAEEAPKTAEGRTPEEIILNAIRTKGKVKRHDLLPLVEISKSTLVRLLNKMEAEGLVVQVGERKASYYALPEPRNSR